MIDVLLTEQEYAMRIAKTFLKIYEALKIDAECKNNEKEVLIAAANVGTSNAVRHYHYYVEANGKVEGHQSAQTEEMATDKQINWIKELVMNKKTLRLPLEQYKALTAGTLKLTKKEASNLIQGAVLAK